MSNPLMRGMLGYSHNNYQTQAGGSLGNPGLALSNSGQTYTQTPTNGASGIQIQYNPMDYSGFQPHQ